MAELIFNNVEKVYPGNVTAVKDFNLHIKDKEFIVFVGPSGCGKSTTLRMIAGLEEISSGEIYIGDTLINDVQPKDRDISMVFQNYALYPHMTVYDNIAFSLKLRKIPKNEIGIEVEKSAKTLGIESLLKRKPRELSGGQKQRVALGRAIIRDPKVFLMDEPLSNLDAKLRVQTRAEIIRLHKKLKTTFIYVTHDQTEAMTMADRIVIMNNGIIEQVDTPQNLYDNPATAFIASFIGNPPMNLIVGKMVQNNERYYFQVKELNILFVDSIGDKLKEKGYLNKSILLGIRAEDISLVEDETYPIEIEGVIDLIELLGAEKYLYISLNGSKVITRVDASLKVKHQDKIKIFFNQERIKFFDNERNLAINYKEN